MDDMQTFEQEIAGVIQRAVGPARPVDAMAVARAASTTSPQWRFQSMFSATKFVVAGAIVALFGGFLLAGALTTPSEEQAPAAGASASAQVEPSAVVTSEPELAAEAEASPAADSFDEPADGLPETARTIVVARDGSGEFATIMEAVDMATTGDSVLIRPGTYEELVVVDDKDITIRGEGDRTEVIIAASDTVGECPYSTDTATWRIRCAMWLRDSDVTVANLTLHGWSGEARHESDETLGLDADEIDSWPAMTWSGGSPRLEGLTVQGGIEGDAPRVEIRDTMVSGQIEARGGSAIVEDNVAHSILASGGDVLVQRNRVGNLYLVDVTGIAQGNEVVAFDDPRSGRGVEISYARPGLIFQENLVRGHRRGIRINSDEASRVVRNRIEGNDRGISITVIKAQRSTSTGTVIADNAYCDNGTNVWVQNGPGLETTDSCSDAE